MAALSALIHVNHIEILLLLRLRSLVRIYGKIIGPKLKNNIRIVQSDDQFINRHTLVFIYIITSLQYICFT